MEALDVETSRAEGEQALQALITSVRENAGKLAAHEAEQGIFKRLLPMGLAAMQRSLAQRGPGDGAPAVTRADGLRQGILNVRNQIQLLQLLQTTYSPLADMWGQSFWAAAALLGGVLSELPLIWLCGLTGIRDRSGTPPRSAAAAQKG